MVVLAVTDQSTTTRELVTADKMEIAHTGLPPTIVDINGMYDLCKKLPGKAILWTWNAKRSSKKFTLSARYPILKDTGWWDYEVRDDPIWLIRDDRELGNNEVWKQKTCDTELVLLCCDMAETRFESEDPTEAAAAIREAAEAEYAKLSSKVFEEIIEPLHLPGEAREAEESIAASLKSCEQRRYTGRVDLTNGTYKGSIFFEYGAPIHATTQGTTGDTAVHEIVTWRSAVISFRNDEKSDKRTVGKYLDLLIAEGNSLFDIKRHLMVSDIRYESYILKSRNATDERVTKLDPICRSMVEGLSLHTTLLDVIRDLELEPFQWAPALIRLLNEELVSIFPPLARRTSALKRADRLKRQGLDSKAKALWSKKTSILKFESLLFYLKNEFEIAEKKHQPLSLIIFDIKKDGPELSTKWLDDELARLIARKMDLLKRPLDVFAHFELTDYALVLPNTTSAQARTLARNLVAILSEMRLPERKEVSRLRVSCGVASIPEHGSNLEKLVTTANQSMQISRESSSRVVTGRLLEPKTETKETAKPIAFQIETIEDETPERIHIEFGELLTGAGVVSPEQFEQASFIATRTQTSIARVLALHEIGINENAGHETEQVLHLINDGRLDLDKGQKAVRLICDQGLSLESALKRLGVALDDSPISELMRRSSIVSDKELASAIQDSSNMSLPLGFVLVSRGLLPRTMVQDIIDAATMVKTGKVAPRDLAGELRIAHEKGIRLRQQLEESGRNLDLYPREIKGELLVLAGALNESELATSRELALLSDEPLVNILLNNGFATEDCISFVNEQEAAVERGEQSLGEAAEKIRKLQEEAESSLEEERVRLLRSVQAAAQAGSASFEKSEMPSGNQVNSHDLSRESSPAQSKISSESEGASVPTEIVHQASVQEAERSLNTKSVENDISTAKVSVASNNEIADEEKNPEPTTKHAVQAMKKSELTSRPPVRILFDAGIINQKDVDLTSVAKKRIESGELSIKVAIKTIRHSKAHGLSFDEALRELESSEDSNH